MLEKKTEQRKVLLFILCFVDGADVSGVFSTQTSSSGKSSCLGGAANNVLVFLR